eukprot:scaffold6874_cov31-Attheya_sp.AAC.1
MPLHLVTPPRLKKRSTETGGTNKSKQRNKGPHDKECGEKEDLKERMRVMEVQLASAFDAMDGRMKATLTQKDEEL